MVERVLFSPGGATEGKQDDILTSLATLLTELQQKLETGGEVALNAATLAALETINANVSGTVAVSNFPATQPVSATALPLPAGASTEATLALIKAKTDNLDVALSTRAVTGLTDAQLRAVAVPVSGTFFQATQPVSGPLTDAQLRAAVVPVAEATGLVPKVYDFIDLGYTGENLTSVVYKAGGAGGTTVATLALAYVGNALDTVART